MPSILRYGVAFVLLIAVYVVVVIVFLPMTAFVINIVGQIAGPLWSRYVLPLIAMATAGGVGAVCAMHAARWVVPDGNVRLLAGLLIAALVPIGVLRVSVTTVGVPIGWPILDSLAMAIVAGITAWRVAGELSAQQEG
jgi:hypothetical protein